MKTNASTRRQFLKQTTALALSAAAFPSLAPATAFGKAGNVAPGNRIAVGCIGVGPQGQGDMGNFLNQKDAQIVAVCDVMKDHLEQARDGVNRHYKNKDCATYADFREAVARKDIDAFLIATPDHWHVLTALAAVRAGKDVYCEKPVTHWAQFDKLKELVHENRKLKRVIQIGTQYVSDHFRNQVRFWGVEASYAFIEQPQTNGVAERFFRTLKEQIIHGRIYRTVAELRAAVEAFVDLYNEQWLPEKNGFMSPSATRAAWYASRGTEVAA